MNIYSIIPIIAFLFNGFVWTYIFAQKKQNQINRAFLIYASFLAGWILIVIILRQNISPWLVMPLMKAASISWLSLAFLFMSFTYQFINKKNDIFYYLCLSVVVVSIVISLTTNMVLKDFGYVGWGVNKIVGPLFLPFVLIDIAFPGAYSIYLISKEMHWTTNNNLKHSLFLMMLGSLITLIIGLISNVIIPLFLGNIHFVEFAESGTVIQSVLIFRAVIKYKLFSVGFEEAAKDIFTHVQDAVIIVDTQGNINQMNKAAEKIFNVMFSHLDKKEISSLIPDFNTLEDNKNVELDINLGGTLKYILLTKARISKDGEEIGRVIIIKDISERKISEEAIRKSEIKFRSVWENSVDAMRLTDENGTIISVNRAFCNLVEMEEESLIGKPLTVTYKGPKAVSLMIDNYKSRFVVKDIPANLEQKIILENSKILFLEISNSFVELESGKSSLLGIFRNVTERKEIQKKLEETVNERIIDMQKFNVSLQRAHEAERTKIAREIHDELGQVLTALKMDVILLSEDIKEGIKNSPEKIISELESIAKLIDGSILTVRNIATELRPDILDHLGLIAAIKWQLQEFQKRNRIKCTFYSETDFIELDKNKTTAAFRIFQEILTNILRHADANEVNVQILREAGSFILQVSDNGKGINADEINNLKSIGILGMRERTEIIGGQFNIISEKDKGTKVMLKVPVTNENIKMEIN
ncbi:MAG: PAS domain S-box protein [Bacteroidetes bacterium]|nr:PAS domain S-box protein [Bacteroidota bacterium]